MRAKFKVGSTVYLDGRTPQFLEAPRHRARTVVGVVYKPRLQACLYKLGDNRLIDDPLYLFRSYMLHSIKDMPGVGRPRQKRRYHFHHNHKLNCVVASEIQGQNQRLDGDLGNCIAFPANRNSQLEKITNRRGR